MKKHLSKVLTLILLGTLLSGCAKSEDVVNIEDDTNLEEEKNGQAEEKNDDLKEEEKDNDEKDADVEDNKDPIELIDLSLKPNETGEVMVLMYHNIGEEEGTWTRTPDNFKKDLKNLYDRGYRAISLRDYANNNINVEAGFTPVVFTFDDGNQNNFNIIEEEGEKIIDPNSAVGIMEEFKASYPDFNMTATFFINGKRPFRQDELIEYKLNWLVDNGYDVGNHTIGHNDMSQVNDPAKIQEYIGLEAQFLESFLQDYKIDTYALSYGGRPDKDLYQYLAEGEHDGHSYKNVAILNVGWDPNVSPVDNKFNPHAIHRVRASETNVDGVGMYDWMDHFDKGNRLRYISDGDEEIITVPKKYEEKIDDEKIGDKILYIYE